MNKLFRIAALLVMIPFAEPAFAEDHYLSGRLINVTTHSGGLLVMIEGGVPTNCAGVGYNWMRIPEASKTMIAAALITWQNKGGATVYTNPLSGGSCVINQFDPWD